jgi:aspartyl-tRNA(Asn)/glutamyl-tRNA(Gln) amidotransferase subunit A
MTAAEPLTIAAAAPLIRSGGLTPSELLEQCLRRIDVYEPAVNACAYLDRERVRRDADRLTAEAKAGHLRGSLHGIPVGVKDIIDVYDMPTGCGSKLWANSYARRDATVVERLRQAGAVILGKTVTTPYAYLDPPPTRNPWDLTRTPGGSSSGSAAAVACGMCLAALGTQTGGSLTRPASYCGVCSLKPTYGRVSVDGVLPLAPSLDHVGVMANCVRDLAVVLQAVADPGDAAPQPYHYTVEIDDRHPHKRGPELAGLPDFADSRCDGTAVAAFDTFRKQTQDAGWAWTDLPLPDWFTGIQPAHRTLMAVEAAAIHSDRIGRQPEDYPPAITELVTAGRRASAIEHHAARQRFDAARQHANRVFVDGWQLVAVPAAGLPPGDGTTGSPAPFSPWSFCGLPVLSLPAAVDNGVPLSVQLVAPEWCEDDLLHQASRLERVVAYDHRLPPVPG